MKIRMPDFTAIYSNKESAQAAGGEVRLGDARAWCELQGGALRVRAAAQDTPLMYLRMRWNFEKPIREPVRVFGDEWECCSGEMQWTGIVPTRCMPWVCMISNGSDLDRNYAGRRTDCFGVKVRPAAMCFWQVDHAGVTLWMDIRNGGSGVLLGGRELQVCEVVFGEYENMSAFSAGREFYKGLADGAIFAKNKVYGSNNWYYAYGKSSQEEIIADAKLIGQMCAGLENRPFMVIDDGWQKNPCDGPWDILRDTFSDMKALADSIRAEGAVPGIWIRFLSDRRKDTPWVTDEMRAGWDDKHLDPSHPAVLEFIAKQTRILTQDWGYRLIKHDFSTHDIFGWFGIWRKQQMSDYGWHFYDRTKTSAEIAMQYYATIRENSGEDCVIIGCNTIGHLVTGYAHLNRTGCDTSGTDWEDVRRFGVNTLAFRMLHHGIFYDIDADCVGIMGKIDWELNGQWLEALAMSGTPLFVSCKPGVTTQEQNEQLRAAFARGSMQADVMQPLDWMETCTPRLWLVNGEEVSFDWYPAEGTMSFYPKFEK